MKIALRLLVAATAAFALLLAMGSPASATTSTAAKKARVKLSVAGGKGQKALLKKGIVVKAKSKGKGNVKTKIRATSRTFDQRKPVLVAKTKRLKLRPKSGKRKTKVTLKLTKKGRSAVSSCQGRTIFIRAGGARTKFDLKRDTAACKPGKVDLSRADNCDFIASQDGTLCMLPFPDDYYTRNDPSSATGKRIDFKDAATPTNDAGVHIAAAPYNLNDGFSPGQATVLRIPGIDTAADLAANKVPTLNQLGSYADGDTSIVAIDAQTGERQPIWVEIDSSSDDPSRTALLIHPSVNFAAGHRYVIAIRSLKTAAGKKLEAPEGFRYYRDDLPSSDKQINSQRKRFDSIFKTLRGADVKRSNLYLAWDFTVASDENIAGRLLHMRDDALAQLGDTNLADGVPTGGSSPFTVSSTQDFPMGPMAREVKGTFNVPCYMTNGCAPGGQFDLDANGLPVQHGTYTANFDCMIPRSAIDGMPVPARPSLYGHGLLGSAGEVTSSPQQALGNNFNIVLCATDEIGLSTEDVAVDVGALGELGKFPQAVDRMQQGLLNEILLGREMIRPTGFASDGAFHVDGTTDSPSVIDPSNLYYDGNSQGGIMGGALTAVEPDLTRSALGVPGMNYSVLLNRSVDFDQYANIALFPHYPDRQARPLVLSMIQMLWDRGEANGYAHRMTTDPLPNTPSHEVLMNVAFGDHQVSTFTADTEARTIGASAHAPVVDNGRWPNVDELWNIPRIGSYPFTGSAIVYWDSGPIRPDTTTMDPDDVLGTNAPPIENVPNRSGKDPHGNPRKTLEEQQMVSDFLRPPAASNIIDTCLGAAGPACHDYTFGGTRAPGN